MNSLSNFLFALGLFFIGQGLVWFQSNGQFIWPVFKNNPWTISLVFGTIASYIFMIATKYIVDFYDGLFWPGRFIGFACGMLAFSILTYIFMNEGLNLKTIISLVLSGLLILIQIFWK